MVDGRQSRGRAFGSTHHAVKKHTAVDEYAKQQQMVAVVHTWNTSALESAVARSVAAAARAIDATIAEVLTPGNRLAQPGSTCTKIRHKMERMGWGTKWSSSELWE